MSREPTLIETREEAEGSHSQEVLLRLSGHFDWPVRKAVAENPFTTRGIIAKMDLDELSGSMCDQFVRAAIDKRKVKFKF